MDDLLRCSKRGIAWRQNPAPSYGSQPNGDWHCVHCDSVEDISSWQNNIQDNYFEDEPSIISVSSRELIFPSPFPGGLKIGSFKYKWTAFKV